MPGPAKRWEEEEDSSSSAPDSPAVGAIRRGKFADEEDDSDVLESWDAAEDSEVEREKAKKAAEAKAKADAEAAANKKSKAQRIEERRAERARALAEADESSDEENEAEKRERLRRTEKEADLRHAEDLFGEIGISNRKSTVGAAVAVDPKDPNNTIDLGSLPIFNPATKTQFELLRNTLGPILAASNKRAHYALFLQEFTKQLAKDLPSDQIKKIASTLTTLSNEKMKEEKAADKTGKKTKAAKTKTTLSMARTTTTDTNVYDGDAFGDDDFM
ncbi:translation initiation factor eIF3 subunit [Thozetella sp. PMI_491]|nr:translation initiation factor eIF3 subunit [Thozetella sp. PMI_491]